MLAKLNTFALVGIDAVPVEVEVDASAGLPKTVLVGLPEMAVKESVHRIERALANLGYGRHPGRTVINLAPADLPKKRRRFRSADRAGPAGGDRPAVARAAEGLRHGRRIGPGRQRAADQGSAVDGDGRCCPQGAETAGPGRQRPRGRRRSRM